MERDDEPGAGPGSAEFLSDDGDRRRRDGHDEGRGAALVHGRATRESAAAEPDATGSSRTTRQGEHDGLDGRAVTRADERDPIALGQSRHDRRIGHGHRDRELAGRHTGEEIAPAESSAREHLSGRER